MILRLGGFNEPLRQIIHAMKYNRRWTIAPAVAERMLLEERVRQLLEQADLLVHVPLHWRRHIGRGYNQSELLTAALAKCAKLPLASAVRRVRSTPSQTGIHSRTEREENVRGAFALRRAKTITGKRVVVVDDVMTTGATLREVGRILKAAKPASLSALVLAVADPKGRDFEGV